MQIEFSKTIQAKTDADGGEVNALAAIDIDVRLLDYSEHTLSEGAAAQAAAYIECAIDGKVLWGVGVDANIVRASLKAVVSAVNRARR
jgi:2-isopropylmalate synthase